MLKAEEIQLNWENLFKYIKELESPRKEQVLSLFTEFEERLVLLPYSYKPQYQGSYPGGWVKSLKLQKQLGFIHISDGSTVSPFQVVATNFLKELKEFFFYFFFFF